jgi:hypothetical protein
LWQGDSEAQEVTTADVLLGAVTSTPHPPRMLFNWVTRLYFSEKKKLVCSNVADVSFLLFAVIDYSVDIFGFLQTQFVSTFCGLGEQGDSSCYT